MSMTTPTTKKQAKKVISPRSLRSGRCSREKKRFIGHLVLDLSTVLVSNAIIMDIPLIRVDQQTYDKFCEGQRVKMDGDSGEITILA